MKKASQALQKLFSNQTMEALGDFANVQGVPLYLVGGGVRDLLLKRQTTDIDFTLETDAITFANAFVENIEKVAKDIRATCVPLKKEPSTARLIVWRDGNSRHQPLNIDFVQFRAASLIEDLRLRDLTINAMAIPFENLRAATDKVYEQNAFAVIDPCGGLKDLEAGVLQLLSEAVVEADPVRLLRLYRFSAQLGFKISESSIDLAKKHRSLLSNAAVERCRDELMKIFDVKKSHLYLQQMAEIGLLTAFVPAIKETDGFCRSLEIFENNLIPEVLSPYRSDIYNYLRQNLDRSQTVNRCSLIKLSLLFAEDVNGAAAHLRLSRNSQKFMRSLFTGSEILKEADPPLSEGGVMQFFRSYMSNWCGILLYTAAAHQISPEIVKQITDTYYSRIVPLRKRGKLITGGDLIKTFGLKQGKQIGTFLKVIEQRQFCGEVRTRKEALALVAALLERHQ